MHRVSNQGGLFASRQTADNAADGAILAKTRTPGLCRPSATGMVAEDAPQPGCCEWIVEDRLFSGSHPSRDVLIVACPNKSEGAFTRHAIQVCDLQAWLSAHGGDRPSENAPTNNGRGQGQPAISNSVIKPTGERL